MVDEIAVRHLPKMIRRVQHRLGEPEVLQTVEAD